MGVFNFFNRKKEEKKTYHENGRLKQKGSYKVGIKEGLWEYYWENGNLQNKGSYKDGEQQGIWEFYGQDDGKLRFKRDTSKDK